jgi:alpha-tubulin suppressor-like RCC1 family protein
VSFRYAAGFNKPGFNPLATPTSFTAYNLWAWGDGQNGSLGTGVTGYFSSPVQVGTTALWSSVTGTLVPNSTFGIGYDGSLWSWGSNNYGQLGIGNTTNYSSPKQIGALTTWLSVAGGAYYAMAIKTDGTIWGWGKNQFGQLGLGNTTYFSSPKQVGTLTNWLQVSCGGYFTLATKTDGTLWAWGLNNYGQLATGNFTYYSSPKQVGVLTTWSKTTASYDYCYATRTNGTLWSWGANPYGQLGLNNTTNYQSPKQVGALTNWNLISSKGGNFVTAIKTDGTLWSWGRNQIGQLGLGPVGSYSSPKQVGSLTNWLKTASGYGSFTIALQTNGTLWSWGSGGDGRTGQNVVSNFNSPKQIGALTTWAGVGASYSNGFAIN